LYTVGFVANAVALIASLFVVFGVTNRIAELIIASPNVQPKGLDAQLIRIVSKLVSLAGVTVIFLEGGRYLGIPVTTLLASAGVGGFAVALAAQDTLRGLFGTIALMADKPFRVGERIVFKNYDGVVEDIGLRSTKVRTLAGNQITVPNDELARIDIENVGRRPHIRRSTKLRIPLSTPRKKVEAAVEIIRSALENHEGMSPEYPPRVYFDEFNADSFNIRIFYWYHPPNYWDFLEFSEKINVKICRAFEEQEVSFTMPTRITYTDREGHPRPLELRQDDSSS
jgi:MscS family membrane protein